MAAFSFTLRTTDGAARLGELRTPHGVVQTPAFMPVGTQGAVKAVHHRELEEAGAEIILGNTYHLLIRPGDELIARRGGLHRFIGWDRPILTDSGGFQVYSLAQRRDDQRGRSRLSVAPRWRPATCSPLNVRPTFRPRLGSDIAMAFDECIAYPATRDQAAEAMARSLRWGERSRRRFLERQSPGRSADFNSGQAQFGIVQGGMFQDLRDESADATVGLGFEGYALGGLSVGEPSERMYELVGRHHTPVARSIGPAI